MLLSLLAASASAQEVVSPGWEAGSAYNQKYDVDDYETLKGSFDQFLIVTPMRGMAEGLALRMTTREGREVLAHLSPKTYLGYDDILPKLFEPGDPIKLKGAFAEIGGKEVFMTSKVRKSEIIEFKFRSTRTGTPYWTLSALDMIDETLEN
jgi:hypothetical protein